VKSFSVRFLLCIFAAELLASFAVWSGTPTDWEGPPLSFWHFEMLRLQYWCAFGLVAAGLWAIGWLSLRRLSTRVVPLLLAALCALATEVMTSIYFWRSLSLSQALFLGWDGFRQYLREHLESWVVVLAISGVCLWYLGRRKLQSQAAVRVVESNAPGH